MGKIPIMGGKGVGRHLGGGWGEGQSFMSVNYTHTIPGDKVGGLQTCLNVRTDWKLFKKYIDPQTPLLVC